MTRSRALRPDAPVAVLFGGTSAEHDVSIRSGTAIVDALRAGGRPVQPVCVDLDGGWWWLPVDHARVGRPPATYDAPATLDAAGPFRPGVAVEILAAADPAPVVFVALHGPFGEDGTVQGMLEVAGLAYTGSGVEASAIGMDKARFKRLAAAVGIPVVEWTEVTAAHWAGDRAAVLADLEAFAARIGEPRLMVKPAGLGSSIGMTIAHRPDERAVALEHAFAYDRTALVERYLDHPRELEVGVVGNDPLALDTYGPGEVIPGHEFYDYAAKYLTDDARTLPTADLPSARVAELRRVAAATYSTVGAEGFARVDFLLEGDRLHVSEVNTIPGFTEISLFPQMCAAAGLPMPALCGRIVTLAVERHLATAPRRLGREDLPR